MLRPSPIVRRPDASGYQVAVGIQPGMVFWAEVHAPAGHDQRGRRPWVVVSQLNVHRKGMAICAPLTSRAEKAGQFLGAWIEVETSDFNAFAGSNKAMDDGLVLCEQARSFPHERLEGQPITQMKPAAFDRVRVGLRYVLGL
jgi:mRNA-degrading endonuclease toxin of MazEF toxin-antitoxin module